MNHDYILLDRSGSMKEAGKWNDSIAAINSYVKGLAERKVDTGATLAIFDTPGETGYTRSAMRFEILRDRIVPSTWREVAPDEVQPYGWTPLNEALLRIVEIANRAGHRNDDHVAIIVLTDGMENASDPIKATRQEAKKALDACRARGWEIVFIGANFDNWAQAEGYGASPQHMYASTASNEVNVLRTMSANRASKIMGESATMDFTTAQKAKLDETNN